MAARRPYSPAETDIIRSGARAGRAGGAIVEQLLAAGFTRSPAGVLSSAAFAEGRADLERDRKQAQIVSGDAGLRARAAKAEPVTPKFDNASDQIIFERARAGASLDAIAEALQKAGCGNPCLSTINRSPAYREAKGQASAKRVARPWSTREIDIVTDGARQGLSGPALQKALAEIGSVRVLRCITASQYYAKGRQLGRDDTARAALEASTAQAKVISDQVPAVPTLSDRRIVRRHPDYPGVSLPFLAIQKDWGEVIAR